jgi:hypothetical protein
MAIKSNLKEVTAKMNADMGLLVKKMMGSIQVELELSTPVDTGWAEANWVPSMGAPIVRSLPEFAIHEREAKAAQVPAAEAEQVSLKSSFMAKNPPKPIDMYITNNVSYIIDLNEGTSPKAPPGFVQVAIIQGIAHMRRMG